MTRAETSDVAPATTGRTRATTVAALSPPRGRSPSTIGRQLREAEKEMARLARQRDELSEALEAAGDDHVELAHVGRELAEVQANLTESENRWLALAEEVDAAR
jgi:hypothetical protein